MQRLDDVTMAIDLRGALTFECGHRDGRRRVYDKLCANCGNAILQAMQAALAGGLKIISTPTTEGA